MTDILFTANGASATALVSGELTSGMVGLPVRFSFDSDWDELNIVAVFDGGGQRISVPLLTDMEAVLPWEVIAKANTRLRIGAEGRKSDGSIVIPTVWANVGYIEPGAKATDDLGNPPTPGIYDQIMAAIEAGKLQGEPGFSPTVSVTDIEGGHRVTITSKDGTESFDVMDGDSAAIEIVDDLYSRNPDAALSANMGVVLREKIGTDLLGVQKKLQAEIKQRVKTVNGVAPDENGNVVVQGGGNSGGVVVETDPTVPAWAKQPNKPTYTASEVGALPASTVIPTVPTKVSAFENDSGYLTEVPAGYAKTEDIPTKPEDIGAQPAGSYLTEVPSGYATEEYVRNKIAEAELGGEEVDLSGYAQKSELPTKVSQLQNDAGYLDAIPDGYAKTEDIPTKPADIGAQPEGDYALRSEIPAVPVKSVNCKTGAVNLDAAAVGARPSTWMPSASDVGALPASTTIPTKVSQLTNDKGYLTQHQDISGKLDASALPTAINTALAQAKASGEFDGEDGQRGTGLLAVTTAPSGYTTEVGGITPKYRMALSTIKTQAGVTEVLLGDTIRYSYYHYPIAYLDSSYAYCTTRVSIRGATGADGSAGIVQQTTPPDDTSVLWVDPSDDTSDGTISEDPLYQYVQKSNITDGYFWYFDSNVALPYKHAYANYSTVEPITLAAGTYCFSPLMVVYSWVKVGNGAVQQIDHYDPAANTSTPFALTFPETTTVWLGYHNPQITAVTPYVVTGEEPLPVGEYFEGEEPHGLESIFDYGVFIEAYIKNCELVANELTNAGTAKGHYTGVKMDANISKLMCKAKIFPNASVALITTARGSSMVSNITFGSVHLVFGLSNCAVGVFDTQDKLRSVTNLPYTITAGEEVAFGFDIDESANKLTVYLPDGTTKTVTDNTISTLNGRYAIWEHFSNTSEGAFASCRMTKFYCKDANGEVLEDDFKRFDGSIGVAPTGQTYRQFTSFNLNSREFK